jgi:hypothetical protein
MRSTWTDSRLESTHSSTRSSWVGGGLVAVLAVMIGLIITQV